jgi:thiol-disulfide isomerase/thioredoxin
MILGPAGQVKAFQGIDLKKTLLDGVTESKLVGEEKIDGQECWKCEFKQEGLTWELWVTKGDQPLPIRVVAKPDYSATPGAPPGMSMTAQINLTNFNLEPKFNDADFTFTPPEGAKKVKSLADAMPGAGPRPPHELVGKAAPEFEIDVLDGEAFKLQDVIGKKVVMLDFWATWCGPCVAALPQISAAAEELKDKDVIFYAVNLRETPEDVKAFLEEQKLDVPVLLDAEGEVGDLYKAAAIPQTVLIGKDGRVQVVHVGFGGDVKQKLIDEITAILEGKDLAQETLDKWEEEQNAADAESEDEDAQAEGEVEVEAAAK